MQFNSLIPCAEDRRDDLLQHSFARRIENLFQAVWQDVSPAQTIAACLSLGDYTEVRIGVLRRAAACNAPLSFVARIAAALPAEIAGDTHEILEWSGISDEKLAHRAKEQRKKKALLAGSSQADIGLALPPEAAQPVVRIHALHPDFFPERQTAGASGFDLRAYLPDATEMQTHPELGERPCIRISAGETILIPTGIAVAIPPGFELQIRPRSGLSRKGLFLIANSPGSCDADFRAQLQIIVRAWRQIAIFHGDRIAQAVIAPVVIPRMISVPSIADLGETDRGSGGFGSTGIA